MCNFLPIYARRIGSAETPTLWSGKKRKASRLSSWLNANKSWLAFVSEAVDSHYANSLRILWRGEHYDIETCFSDALLQ